MFKKYIYTILLLFICSRMVSAGSSEFNAIKQNLIKDGFDSVFIENIYKQSEAEFISHIITINVKQTGNGSNYVQYYDDSVAEKVRDYIAENSATLNKIYEKYGVPPEVICSIFMIETKLGSYMGKHRVMNIYSSMAASNTDEAIDDIYKRYQDDAELADAQKFSREDIVLRVKKKSDWAYSELKFFLKYIKDNNVNPYDVKGSFSGAFGLAQFIPSSFFNFAVDGDSDGKVDIFDQYDAMASIANYLKENGWKKDLSEDGKKRVIGTYNHSKFYVDAVVGIAEKVKSLQN